jgi:anaerobic selenocysteine-containing dehydrogenase
VRARLAVSDTVVRGVAALPGKWWSGDTGGRGLNALTPARWSPRGQPAYNDVEVTITAVTADTTADARPVSPGRPG